ncbi:hypothetical protein D3C81_1887860 [compost metagenome]
MSGALKLTAGGGIFEFCGIEVLEHFLFGGVTTVATDEDRSNMLAQVKAKFSSL